MGISLSFLSLGEECEGLHEVLLYSIQKSDLDLRKVLFKNIVLSGGSTLFKGFGDRLLSEIKRMSPKEIQIKVSILFFKFVFNSFSFRLGEKFDEQLSCSKFKHYHWDVGNAKK